VAAASSFGERAIERARVMPGLDPGIHSKRKHLARGMDCRVEPGNDDGEKQ